MGSLSFLIFLNLRLVNYNMKYNVETKVETVSQKVIQYPFTTKNVL